MKYAPARWLGALLLTLGAGLHAADTVYIGVDDQLLRSTDAGATWQAVDVPLNTPFMKGFVTPHFLAVDPENTSKIYFIGFAGGTSFYASSDAGDSWTVTPFIGLQPSHLVVDHAGKAIYISASPNHGSTFVYKSTDSGATWKKLPLPSTQQEPSGATVDKIFADPQVSGTVYALADNSYHLFKSTDFGSTWTEINLASFKKPSLVDPHNSLIWYSYSGNDANLFKSVDGASTFTALDIPSDRVTSVSVGANSNTLYATGDVAGIGGTVLKSSDGGDTWTALTNGLFTALSGIVWADPVNPSPVFVNDSIYPRHFNVSTDGGAHFNPSKLPNEAPDCVPGNCATPEIYDLVFAATIPPPPVITSVVNGASFEAGVVANSWVTIAGTGLAPKIDDWSHSIVNGVLPKSLDGVSVSVSGKAAYIYFISPDQLNVLAPNVSAGPVNVTVTTSAGTSPNFPTTANVFGPAFFLWPDHQAVATRQDFSFVAKAGTFPGATTIAAKPGDVVILWATGFGPTIPAEPIGSAIPGSGSFATATLPTVTVDNKPAMVFGAALAPGSAGLYQIAIQVPNSLSAGDWPVLATIGGVESPTGVVLSVQ